MRSTFIPAFVVAAAFAAPALAQTAPDASPPASAAGGQQQGAGEGAQINVQQPAPQITVQQPPPQVTVTQPQPEVTIEQPKPEVTVTQPQPEVNVQQPGQPNVQVEQTGQPDVTVQQPGSEQAQGQQAPPQQADTTGAVTGTPGSPSTTAGGSWFDGMRGEQIVGQTLYGANGEEIGDVENLVISRQGSQSPAAVVGVGGFLGIGERQVTIPLDQIQMGQDNRLTTSMTKEQIGGMQAYDEGGYELWDRSRVIGEGMSR